MTTRDEDRAARARAQEQRAIEALDAIFAGGDLTEESMKLSNEFTDRQAARLTKWLKRD